MGKDNAVSYMPDYTVYSSQMAKITPKPLEASKYSVTNTAAAACPTANSTWNVATNLPPTPDEQVCQCMVDSAKCVPASGLSAKDTAKLLGVVCGLPNTKACAGIQADGSKGVYGVYSPCDTSDQLVYALNAYYAEQSSKGNAASACDFSGSATLVTPKSTGSCGAILSSASAQATATGGSGGSGGASSSTSKGAAAGIRAPPSFGPSASVQIGLYAFVAITSGALMILL